MARFIGRTGALILALVLIGGAVRGEPAVRNGCIGTAESRVPDASALLGQPFDFRVLADRSVEVAYSTGDQDGTVQVCRIGEDSVTPLESLKGIWGPKLIPDDRVETVVGLRLQARSPGSDDWKSTGIAVAAVKPDEGGKQAGESVLALGKGPIQVFRLAAGVFIVQGADVLELGVDHREVGRWKLDGPSDSRIFSPQVVGEANAPLVVAVAHSAKGAEIVSGALGQTLGGKVSDRLAPRIGSLQALQAGNSIYCFWTEQQGRTRRLMVDASQDHGKSWGTDRVLAEAVRDVTFDARGGNGRILLAWRTGERFDRPSRQTLTVGEVDSKGLIKKREILQCGEDCAISGFDIDISVSGREFLAVSVQRSGRGAIEAYSSDGGVDDFQRIQVNQLSELGTINCLRVSSLGRRFVLIYRFERAVRSFLQPFIQGQLCFSIVDFQE